MAKRGAEYRNESAYKQTLSELRSLQEADQEDIGESSSRELENAENCQSEGSDVVIETKRRRCY